MRERAERGRSGDTMQMLGLKREIDQVAKDKGIDSQEIISALEEAMKQAARREARPGVRDRRPLQRRARGDRAVRVPRGRRQRRRRHPDQIAIGRDAEAFDPDAELGDEIGVKIDTTSFGRILAQTAKQVIIQRIRDAERDNVFEEYKDRQGEVVNGIVRRFEKGAIIVDLGRAEAVLPLEGAGAARELPSQRSPSRLRDRGQQSRQGVADRAVDARASRC